MGLILMQYTTYFAFILPTSAASGAMYTRGGSDGGLGLMATSKPHPTDAAHTLGQRNLPPSAEGGTAGNSEAWKYKK